MTRKDSVEGGKIARRRNRVKWKGKTCTKMAKAIASRREQMKNRINGITMLNY
jgi:hypothetical protein